MTRPCRWWFLRKQVGAATTSYNSSYIPPPQVTSSYQVIWLQPCVGARSPSAGSTSPVEGPPASSIHPVERGVIGSESLDQFLLAILKEQRVEVMVIPASELRRSCQYHCPEVVGSSRLEGAETNNAVNCYSRLLPNGFVGIALYTAEPDTPEMGIYDTKDTFHGPD